MRILPAAALTVLAALAGTAPALGSAFTEPVTLADWSLGGGTLAVADGAAAWSHPTGVRISAAGGVPIRVPGDGLVQDIDVASADDAPVVAWADAGARLHAYTGRVEIVRGTMDEIRKVAAAPSALAWIGIPASGDRKLQVAIRRDGGFSSARTPEQLGEPAFGVVAAAGTGSRSLFAYSAHDADTRRVELLAVDARDGATQARWITSPDDHAATPDVALGPNGAGVLAWVGQGTRRIVTAAPVTADGTLGAAQVLDGEVGGPPAVAVGPGGAAVVAWFATGRLRVALRAAGAAGFSAPVTMPSENVLDGSAAVTARGETIVSWLADAPGAGAREGARLFTSIAPPGGALGAPEVLAAHVSRVGGAGDALTWIESRPDSDTYTEHRVRYARLRRDAAGGGAGGGGASQGDRRAPRVKLRVLGVRGRRIRVELRSDERAALRATWRRGARTVGRARGTLRASRPRVLKVKAPAGARRITLTVRATDAAGNARALRRVIRLRRAR